VRGGYIYLHGRRDEMLKVGGEKVSPLEIERALAEHSDIVASAVGATHDPQRREVPIAYVELSGPIDRQQLTAFLSQRLAPVKVPVRYFEVRSFPVTANGKLQRSRLRPDDRGYVIREIL
jgi:acyl-coenzyme A synthetase/AMP-(fatty) acid ligase